MSPRARASLTAVLLTREPSTSRRLHHLYRETELLAQRLQDSGIPFPAPAQGEIGADHQTAHLEILLEIEDKLPSAECSNFSSKGNRNDQVNPQAF